VPVDEACRRDAVQIDANSDTTHRRAILNDAVIPEVKALSGFQAGTWMNYGAGTGMCIVVFDNDEHARAAMISLTAPGGPPVLNSAIYSVEIEVKPEPTD
jgi:hypothetical protein